MLQDERTLIVVAVGAQARLIEERRLGGALHEVEDWSVGRSPPRPISGSPRHAVARLGHCALAGGRSPRRDQIEDHFLADVAARVAALAGSDAFDSVVLIAPPRALGRLRAALSATISGRLRHAEARDRVKSDLDTLRTALATIRRLGL